MLTLKVMETDKAGHLKPNKEIKTMKYYVLKQTDFNFQNETIIGIYFTMKQVDSKGHYEADDETGFFFQQLKQLQELLNGIFENEKEESIGAKKTEKN